MGMMPQGPYQVLVIVQGILLLPSFYSPAWLVDYIIPNILIGS